MEVQLKAGPLFKGFSEDQIVELGLSMIAKAYLRIV